MKICAAFHFKSSTNITTASQQNSPTGVDGTFKMWKTKRRKHNMDPYSSSDITQVSWATEIQKR